MKNQIGRRCQNYFDKKVTVRHPLKEMKLPLIFIRNLQTFHFFDKYCDSRISVQTFGMRWSNISQLCTSIQCLAHFFFGYLRVSNEIIMNPCPFIQNNLRLTSRHIASHPDIHVLSLNNFFFQYCKNIDQITISNVTYLRQRTDAC